MCVHGGLAWSFPFGVLGGLPQEVLTRAFIRWLVQQMNGAVRARLCDGCDRWARKKGHLSVHLSVCPSVFLRHHHVVASQTTDSHGTGRCLCSLLSPHRCVLRRGEAGRGPTAHAPGATPSTQEAVTDDCTSYKERRVTRAYFLTQAETQSPAAVNHPV